LTEVQRGLAMEGKRGEAEKVLERQRCLCQL
jgi:hypothetical protein